MELALVKTHQKLQNPDEYALGVAKFRVWGAEMQALKLAIHSSKRTAFGYVLHMTTEAASAFGFSMYKGTPVLIVPNEIRNWFGMIPWRSIVCTAGRLFLITEIEKQRFSISLPLSSVARKLAKLDEVDITYMQVGENFALNNFIGIYFTYDESLLSMEEYHDAI